LVLILFIFIHFRKLTTINNNKINKKKLKIKIKEIKIKIKEIKIKIKEIKK